MKVKLIVGLAGPAGAWEPGDSFDCTAEEAARLIERGYAEPFAPPVERSTKPAPRVRRTK